MTTKIETKGPDTEILPQFISDEAGDSPAIVFFGSSNFSVKILEHLEEAGLTPHIIVTTEDKPQGRKLLRIPSPVKVWANKKSIKVLEPDTLKKNVPKELNSQENGEVWDLFIVVSYGEILSKSVLDLPRRGVLNVHPSLLPKLRGASPIQSAILQDMKKTGVTVILLDEKLDHGPIVAQASTEIENWPPKASLLEEILAKVGGGLLAEIVLPWINGDIDAEEQRDADATYVKKITKEDGLINLNDDPRQNFLKIQAFDTWPGTYFFVEKNGKKIRVKVVSANFENGELIITRVIPESKKEMSYKDFKRGL